MASGVFGLRKVYKKQVQNVTDNNLASWPESNSFGYLIGGEIPAASSHINKLDFSTDSITFISSVLPSTISRHSALSSDLYGYYAGGLAPTYSNVISRLDFSNETISLPGNNLASAKVNLAATSSDSYGYFGGGYSVPPTVYYCNIDRLDISNETVSNPGNLVPGAGKRYMATVESASHGYFAGGSTSPIVCTISRIDFTSETLTDLANGLPTTRSTASGVSNQSYGYIVGGYSPVAPGITCTISRLDFTSETSTDLANGLPTATEVSSISSSSSFGYHMGGQIPTIVPTIFRLDFSNETISNPGNGLPIATSRAAAVSGGTSVARGNGYKTYGYVSTVTQYIRFDFLSETATDSSSASSPGSITSHGVGQISNNNYGYFAGNIPSITKDAERLDFSNETVSSMGEFLPVEMYYISPNVKSSNYGYQVGGFYPPSLEYSNVRRLEFSSEVFYNIPTVMPEKGRYSQNFSTQSYGYFMGGYYYDAPGDDWFTTISRLDFISETVSIIGSIGPTTCDGRTAVQNNLNGYVCGGSFPYIKEIYKMEFSTENVSAPGNMPYEISGAIGLPDTHYGYICGGWSPASPTSSNISKLDFSTEIVSGPTNKFPAGIRSANAGTPN